MDIKRDIIAHIKQELHASCAFEASQPIDDFNCISLPAVEEVQVVALSDDVLADVKLWQHTIVALRRINVYEERPCNNIIGYISINSSHMPNPQPSTDETHGSSGDEQCDISRQQSIEYSEGDSHRWPCGICGKNVGTNSILCQCCKFWIHHRCSGVKGKLHKVAAMRAYQCRKCALRSDSVEIISSSESSAITKQMEVDITENSAIPMKHLAESDAQNGSKRKARQWMSGLVCRLCRKIVKNSFLLKDHYFAEHNSQLLQCKKCEQKFLHQSGLMKHMLKHKMCIQCKRPFGLLHQLGPGQPTVEQDSKSPYGCGECLGKFSQFVEMKEHLYSAHHCTDPACCSLCRRGFVWRASPRVPNGKKLHN